MQKAILTFMKLDGDVKTYNFQTGNGSYLLFSCSSLKPDKSGIYFKITVQAYDSLMDKIIRMKLKAGSVIDMVCDMTMFASKSSEKGEVRMGYKVTDINFSEFYGTQEKVNQLSSDRSSVQQKRLNDFYNSMQKDPFAL